MQLGYSLNDSLKANGNQLYMDYHDGKYGINTSALRGADTFVPFRGDLDYKEQTLSYEVSLSFAQIITNKTTFTELTKVYGVKAVSINTYEIGIYGIQISDNVVSISASGGRNSTIKAKITVTAIGI